MLECTVHTHFNRSTCTNSLFIYAFIQSEKSCAMDKLLQIQVRSFSYCSQLIGIRKTVTLCNFEYACGRTGASWQEMIWIPFALCTWLIHPDALPLVGVLITSLLLRMVIHGHAQDTWGYCGWYQLETVKIPLDCDWYDQFNYGVQQLLHSSLHQSTVDHNIIVFMLKLEWATYKGIHIYRRDNYYITQMRMSFSLISGNFSFLFINWSIFISWIPIFL